MSEKENFPTIFERIKAKAREIKRETYILALAYHLLATPRYAKIFAALVVAYAFSPIDLGASGRVGDLLGCGLDAWVGSRVKCVRVF